MIVVDASLGFKWLVQEEHSDIAITFAARHDMVAPSLFRAEIANALLKKCIRSEIDRDAAGDALAAIDEFVEEWVELAELTPLAFAIAQELTHPVYDCYYLALAQQRQIELATADERLRARCVGTRFDESIIDWKR